MGSLIANRNGQNGMGVTFIQGHFLVVGGGQGGVAFKTEKCKENGDTMTCVQQAPELLDYSYYPELFVVNEHNCHPISL